MNYEVEINKLNARLDNLQQSFIQAQKNQVPITAKTDDTANKVVIITPYTETKTAYIDDTDIVFIAEAKGNLTVYLSEEIPYTVERDANKITVSFEPLEQVTEVTISIL